MIKNRWFQIAPTLFLLIGLAGGVVTAADAANPSAGNVTDASVRANRASGEDWPVYGGRLTGEHYSPLDQIKASNVEQLGLAWAADIPSPLGLTGEPLVVDGVVYLSAPLSIVYALDASTGNQIWRFDPQVRLDLSPGNSVAARINRGVAVWKGLVYVGTGDCRLVAIDAVKGKQVWEAKACDVHDGGGTGVTAAPRVGDDKVFVGYLGSDTAARGSIGAYDAKTGKELWRFWTVPGDPAKGGFETPQLKQAAATWANGWGPGGAVWEEIRYDPVTDQVIFGTASTLPLDVKQRGSGDNLYINSVIALDADTGKYNWHYQTVPEDGWDFDATMPKIITDINIDGKQRRVVFEAGKSGFFYVLDARTGELLSADPFQKTTWASAIDLETGRPVVQPEARYWESKDPNPIHVFPSANGGRNWEPMAWDPKAGLVYMPVADVGTKFCGGAEMTETAFAGCAGLDAFGLRPGEKLPPNPGRLVAWDPLKREVRWSIDRGHPLNGGVLATAGNLVFEGLSTGELEAYNSATGEELWSVNTGSSIQASPVTFRIGEEQFILVASGAGGGIRMASHDHTTAAGARGPSRVLAFKLGGDKGIPIATTVAPRIPQPPPRKSSEQAQLGAVLWGAVGFGCNTCHGDYVSTMSPTGGFGAPPDLRYLSPAKHSIWNTIVIDGAFAAKGMFAFGPLGMKPEDAEAIQAHVIEEAWKAYEVQEKAEE